jgi:hypothetical protein
VEAAFFLASRCEGIVVPLIVSSDPTHATELYVLRAQIRRFSPQRGTRMSLLTRSLKCLFDRSDYGHNAADPSQRLLETVTPASDTPSRKYPTTPRIDRSDERVRLAHQNGGADSGLVPKLGRLRLGDHLQSETNSYFS